MARKSRHYRAARKAIEYKAIPHNGIFIKDKQKPAIVMGIALIAVILFLKGFIFGTLSERNRY